MKIAVCVKRVPDTASQIKLNADQSGIAPEGVKFIISPYDEFGVEEALKIKENKGEGDVSVITVGNEKAQDVLRSALAMGCDKAVLIESEKNSSLAAAKCLAAKIKAESYDLVFTGKNAIDDDASQVSQMTAQLLSWPHVSSVSSFELTDNGTAKVHRDVNGGDQEVWEIKLPAVFAATKGLNQPRYASLKGIMQSKSKPIEKISVSDLGLSEESLNSNVTVHSLEMPQGRQEGQMFKDNPQEAIKTVVQKLREEAKVI